MSTSTTSSGTSTTDTESTTDIESTTTSDTSAAGMLATGTAPIDMTAFGDASDRVDRLYRLLPAIYRSKDAEQGYPLQALLRVIAEQVNIVEDDIENLYRNLFIETAEQWAVPYIADLIGYQPVKDPRPCIDNKDAEDKRESKRLNRVLVPRREVANTIRYRRRKGTLALLELLAMDIAQWPARAVEFYKRLDWTQNINHLYLDRARTVDLRDCAALELIDGPFDKHSHTVDIRRINARLPHHKYQQGRYNIPSVGVFIWRLNAYPVTCTPAYCVEEAGRHCYTFSILGQDAPIFNRPRAQAHPSQIAEAINLPSPIRRRALADQIEELYGETNSFTIWAHEWAAHTAELPVPATAIIAADLSAWHYVPPKGYVAVDPLLGRIAFPPGQLPKKGVRVSYHYGFSADMGGGQYLRRLLDPVPPADLETQTQYYRVGSSQVFHTIGDALRQWESEKPADAVIEIVENGVFVEPIRINMGAGQTLQLRAANHIRPVIRLLDWQTDLPDSLSIKLAQSSRFSLDGLLVSGRGVHISSIENAATDHCSRVNVRHCTLVPGWEIDGHCKPKNHDEPSLELFNLQAKVCIEHCILGPIQVHQDEVHYEPTQITLSDSIIDAGDPQRECIGAADSIVAHALLNIDCCTLLGIVSVHAVELAQNSIFYNCLNVARRQIGCMRFCYINPGCRTPRRYYCQPDLVTQAAKQSALSKKQLAGFIASEQRRVRPMFTDIHYGLPGYGQLSTQCAEEIKKGADDEAEMGAFHDLFQPQREENLRVRLQEFTPADMDVGLIFAT